MQQRGMGAHTLCASCNSRTGSWYAPELIRWAQWGVRALRELPPAEQEDRDPEKKMAVVRFPEVHPLRFIKQTIAMLLAINDRGRMHEELALSSSTGTTRGYLTVTNYTSPWSAVESRGP